MGDTFPSAGTLFPRINTLNEGSSQNLVRLQLLNQADAFLFDDDGNPAGGEVTTDLRVIVADANGKRVFVADGIEIQVDISGGTAANKKLQTVDGSVVGIVNGSIIVPTKNGEVLIRATVTSTGSMALALTDVEATNLTVTDTSTLTFS